MMIKGCLLALAISSTYAAEDKPGGGGSANSNRARNGVRSYNRPYKAGGSNSGNGTSKLTPNRRWGNRRRKPRTGRIRRRKPRPANWRPNRPANWQEPTESESYDNGGSYEDDTDDGDDYTDNGYDKCDAQLRSTCCDLPESLSVQDKKDICYAVGCNYDKCDWSNDGYETLEPTSEPTWSADGWQKDGWNDDGHYVCLAVDQAMCCNLPESVSDYKKMSLCDKLGCDYDLCDWSDDGWKHDTDEPTSSPTTSPTVSPTESPTFSPTGDVCNVQSRDICCNQSDKKLVDDKKRVCDRLGCMYKKCGWKKDGYDDDESKPAWKNDGYDNNYDDKYDVDYNKVKDLYDEQWNYKEKNNGGNAYKDDNYGSDDDKYDHVNDYDDDKCTSEERRVCCTANQKKQWKVCNILGCNMRKCDKRDWDDDDDGDDANNINTVRYNNKIPTARPTWRNNPYYMNGYNNRPTLRPTYRTYSTNTVQGGYQGGSYARPVYNPYAPATPYNPNSIYTPPNWQGDTYAAGYKASEPADSTWQGDTYTTGYTAAEPDDAWAGDSYKKYKKEKPSASPTQSPVPSVSFEPSISPSESFAPSVSLSPSKAKKRPKGYGHGGGSYDKGYTKKYDQDMKSMKGDLQELKQLLQMSISEEADEDDSATEAAYVEAKKLTDELAQLKILIAQAYVRDEVGEEDTDYLETTLSEVEAQVVEVEKVMEEKVKKEKVEKVEAEADEVEKVEAEAVEDEKVLEDKKKTEKTEKTDKKKKKKKGE